MRSAGTPGFSTEPHGRSTRNTWNGSPQRELTTNTLSGKLGADQLGSACGWLCGAADSRPKLLDPRVSELCGGAAAGPGVQADLIVAVLSWPDGGKSGLEELTAQPGEHVGGRRAGLGAVPRAQLAPPADVGGVVGPAGVPADQQGLDEEPEWDGALDGLLRAVAGISDAQDLLSGRIRRLDGPPPGVALGDGGRVSFGVEGE